MLNGKRLSTRKELIGQLPCVFLSVLDIALAEGSSRYRRQFLDSILSFQKPNYLTSLVCYTQALRQRNKLLKELKRNPRDRASLEVWDMALIEEARKISRERIRFVENFQGIFHAILKRISQDRDMLNLDLKLSHNEEFEHYGALLRENQGKDILSGHTSLGPHKHDIIFYNEKREPVHSLSQGQKRTLSLSMRLAQFYFLREHLGFPPILLIDDVTGELDRQRQQLFMEILTECNQAILAAPQIPSPILQPQAKRLELPYLSYHIPCLGSEPIAKDAGI